MKVKKESQNLFKEYDNGSIIDSDQYEKELKYIFLKPAKHQEEFFKSPLKYDEENKTPSFRKSQIPVRETPFKDSKSE